MGCANSTPVKEDVEYRDQKRVPLPPSVEAALSGATRRGVSFAGDVRDSAAQNSPDSISRGVSISGRPSHSSLIAKREKSFVGADLHAIMDDQGMLNPLVSRQLSVMSHYSVRSESGNVMITPEEAEAPFKLLRLIGRGGFGNVYLGDWDNEKVAIKIIAGNTNSDSQEEHEWEARKERMAQMEAILMSAINHPNIVRTYKVTSHSGEHLDPELLNVERALLAGAGAGETDTGIPSFEWHIIMEFCDRGSLSKALASFRLHEPIDNMNVKWDAWASLETLKEIVSALIFLHEHNILHGDLKAANVLLASSSDDRRRWIAKVADFGLARVLKDKGHIKTQTFGTVTHMPPELLAKGMLSPSSDVYAVGVLMWEIFTGEKVFKQLSDSEVILAVVTKKARPTFPADCPPKYKFLAEKCWADMQELRPSLDTLLNELDNLQQLLCPQGPETSRIVCKVYPTRQRALEQYRQQIASAASAAATGSSNSPAPTSPRAPTATPAPIVQKVNDYRQRKSAGDKGASPLGRESKGDHQTVETSLAPRTKSMAAAPCVKSPLSNAVPVTAAGGALPIQGILKDSSGSRPGSAHGSGANSPRIGAMPASQSPLAGSMRVKLDSNKEDAPMSSPRAGSVAPTQVRFDVK